MFFLGGFSIVKTGWLSTRAVYLDFATDLTGQYLYQLYENRSLIGATRRTGERRVVGQLIPSISPAPLSLIRVDASDGKTDFGSLLPLDYFNRFELVWTSSGSSDVNYWQIVAGAGPGIAVSANNVIGRVPFTGDGVTYSWQLDSIDLPGTWNYGVVPVDNGGATGSLVSSSVIVALPPADVTPDVNGNRFTVTAVSGVGSVGFSY